MKKTLCIQQKGALLKEATSFKNLDWNGSIDIKMEGVIKVPLYIQIIVRKLKEKEK